MSRLFPNLIQNRKNERGNVLWFILLAVALLSILTLLISRSGSSVDQSGNTEQLKIKASQLLRYAASIEQGIELLKTVNGCSENEISFENSVVAGYTNAKSPSDNSCHVFEKEGAGLNWRTFSDDELTLANSNMHFARAFNINNLGNGSGAAGNEIFMAARVSQTLCYYINNTYGISTSDADISAPSVAWNRPFNGTFAPTLALGTGGEADGISGEQTGCLIDNNGHYVFFHAVLVR